MIDLNLTLILTEAIIFLFLLIVLNKILIKPIVSHIDSRSKSIKDGLGSANQNSHEVSELEKQAEEIIRSAKVAAQELRNTKLGSVKKAIHDKIEAKKAAVEEELKQFNNELLTRRVDLKASLVAQSPVLNEALKAKLFASSN
ncbi:MAG: F-type H+-transporting ATPase subunit b [Campylobacterota bacterium]|nr:F-type H+-transporting ATPase subunit b [Campylobacterota bacterium]